jgi:putative hemolysin
MNDPLYYFLILICVLLSALFTVSEAALLSVNRITLKHLIQQKIKKANQVLLLKEKPNHFINALLIGNNTVNILATSLATKFVISQMPNDQNKAVLISTIAMTLLIVIFGETLPKNIGANYPTKLSLFLFYPVKFTMSLFSPLVWVLNLIVTGFSKLFSLETKSNSIITNQMELETVIDISQEEGIIEKEERSLIKSIFEFSDTKVYEIMVQRVDMVSVDVLDGIESVMKEIGDTG